MAPLRLRHAARMANCVLSNYLTLLLSRHSIQMSSHTVVLNEEVSVGTNWNNALEYRDSQGRSHIYCMVEFRHRQFMLEYNPPTAMTTVREPMQGSSDKDPARSSDPAQNSSDKDPARSSDPAQDTDDNEPARSSDPAQDIDDKEPARSSDPAHITHNDSQDEQQAFPVQSRKPKPDSLATADLWHRRMGHPGPDVVENLMQAVHGARVRGLTPAECEVCAVTKAHRIISRRPRESKSRGVEVEMTHFWRPGLELGGRGRVGAVRCSTLGGKWTDSQLANRRPL